MTPLERQDPVKRTWLARGLTNFSAPTARMMILRERPTPATAEDSRGDVWGPWRHSEGSSPRGATIGLDPVQLGLIMIPNLGIGLYTPPIGTTLFISSSIAGTSLGETTRELWPFFAVAIALLLALSYIPALTLY